MSMCAVSCCCYELFYHGCYWAAVHLASAAIRQQTGSHRPFWSVRKPYIGRYWSAVRQELRPLLIRGPARKNCLRPARKSIGRSAFVSPLQLVSAYGPASPVRTWPVSANGPAGPQKWPICRSVPTGMPVCHQLVHQSLVASQVMLVHRLWVGGRNRRSGTHLQPKWHTVCTRLRTSRHHHPCRTPATRGMTHPSACPSLRHTSWVAGATTAPARPTRQMGVTLDRCWHPFSLTVLLLGWSWSTRRLRDARRSNI